MTGIAATTLQHTTRYYPPGVRAIIAVPTIAAPSGIPTLAEINAGTDLTPEIVDGGVTGFKTTASTMDAPDLGGRVTRKVAGRITLDDSSLNMYASNDSDDARTLFTDGEVTNIVIFPEGTATKTPALLMDIHPVTVMQTTIDQDTSKVANFTVDFSASDVPVKNVPIPTV